MSGRLGFFKSHCNASSEPDLKTEPCTSDIEDLLSEKSDETKSSHSKTTLTQKDSSISIDVDIASPFKQGTIYSGFYTEEPYDFFLECLFE